MNEIENKFKIGKKRLNTDINNYYINILNEAKEIIEGINKESLKLNELIQIYIKNCEELLNKKDIEKIINYLKKNKTIYEDKISELKNKFKKFYDITSNIYINSFIKKIKELNEKLNNTFLNMNESDFYPPEINDFNDSSIHLLKFDKFYQDSEEEEKEKIKDIILCSICSKKESICFCEPCNQLFCQECLNIINEAEKFSNQRHRHNLIYIENIKSKNEKSKFAFLFSIKYIIQYILMKSNYLINMEKIKAIDISNNLNNNLNNNNSNNYTNFKINYIKRSFEYPYITNRNDFDSQIEFLKGINSILKNELNQNNINSNNSFHISEMNKEIIFTIKNIFIDEKINLFKEALSIIEDNFYSDDDSYEDEKNFVLGKSENEFNEIKNKFYYSINMCAIRNNTFFNMKNIKELIINRINSNLLIERENIIVSFNNKCSFIDNFIRTKEFCDLSIQKIKINFPNLNELYEYKLIINELLGNQCNLKNYIDYRGNFIIPNKNLNIKRGTEEYDPPYGWIGIGLNVLGKYDNDDWLNDKDESSKWAIAYHGLGRMKSFDEIKYILRNVIIKKQGLIPGSSQIKCHFKDIRHKGKKVGTGVYLTQSLNIAEGYSGIIPYNNKKYKIILMARVKIDKIKEPEDFNYWILNKEYIRVYRILLKEKK